jgi:hypothetical protein
MFYLIYVMFLFAGHNGLLTVSEVASWGGTWPGAALDSQAAYGLRDRVAGS